MQGFIAVAPTPSKTANECVSKASEVCTLIEANPLIPKSTSLEFIAPIARAIGTRALFSLIQNVNNKLSENEDIFDIINFVENGAKAEGKIAIDRSLYGIKYKSKSWYTDLGDNFINDIFYLYFSLIALPIEK